MRKKTNFILKKLSELSLDLIFANKNIFGWFFRNWLVIQRNVFWSGFLEFADLSKLLL